MAFSMGALGLHGQTSAAAPSQEQPAAEAGESHDVVRVDEEARTSYLLGPEDELRVSILEAPEASRENARVDAEGQLHLPWVGRLTVGGLTLAQAEALVTERYRTYIHDPHVTMSITAFRSRMVSVIGAVSRPGVQPLRGPRSLVEILSLAGGLSSNAGHSVKITRHREAGAIPLDSARVDSSGQFSVAEVSLADLTDAQRPEQNILVLPRDVISVPRARMVYVIGAVREGGGFPLGEEKSISVVQALALAGGIGSSAAPKRTRILRNPGNRAQRVEIPIDLEGILEGRSEDAFLQPDDILFVPTNRGKIAAKALAEAAIRIGTGIAIFSSR